MSLEERRRIHFEESVTVWLETNNAWTNLKIESIRYYYNIQDSTSNGNEEA